MRVLALCALLTSTALLVFERSALRSTAGGTADIPLPKTRAASSRRITREVPSGSPSPEELQHLASQLPQPTGQWLQIIASASYSVPSLSAAFTNSLLSALVRLFPPAGTPAGAASALQLEALQLMVDALADLLGGSSAATSPPLHSTAPLRRLCTAALLHMRAAQASSPAPHWGGSHASLLSEALLLWLSLHQRQALHKRVELTHISKTGGTSICKLARASGCRNPHASAEGNCMLPAFDDWPLWTRVVAVQHGGRSHKLTPACAMYCPAYQLYGAHGADAPCQARAAADLRGSRGDARRCPPALPPLAGQAPGEGPRLGPGHQGHQQQQQLFKAAADSASGSGSGSASSRPLAMQAPGARKPSAEPPPPLQARWTSTRRRGSCTAAPTTPPARRCARSCSA
jgi:hypothetical protein